MGKAQPKEHHLINIHYNVCTERLERSLKSRTASLAVCTHELFKCKKNLLHLHFLFDLTFAHTSTYTFM